MLNDQVVQMRRGSEEKRASFILSHHQPAVAGGASPLGVLATQVDGIRTKSELQGWQNAFDAAEAAEVAGSQGDGTGARPEATGLPGHQRPAETTGTPAAAPKPH